MRDHVLITGGAGFIGSHLCDELLRFGYQVRVLDNLSPQVHGIVDRPADLDGDVELQVGDVRDRDAVKKALQGIDVVYHLAARVGVGQSMYRIDEYVSVNNHGTAVLLEELVRRPMRRLIVASSMSIYGEGSYSTVGGTVIDGPQRSLDRLRRNEWELVTADGGLLRPVPTSEAKTPSLQSVYALSKYDQERMSLLCGRAYHMPVVALRFFNVYGPRQALSNPYTGVLAIFAARLLNDQRPIVFEDGLQQRDFVSVRDIVRAAVLALETEEAAGHVLNVGSGEPRTIGQVAETIATAIGRGHLAPEITGKYRQGDVRHCFADISEAERILGFRPNVSFQDGIAELAEYLEGRSASDSVLAASAELEARGLTL